MALLLSILPVVVALVAVAAYQHLIYHNVRTTVGDKLNYVALETYTANHLVTIFKLQPGSDAGSAAKELKSAVKRLNGQGIYFGRKAAVAYQTSQLDPIEWEVVALTQWDSTATMQRFVDSAASSVDGVEEMFHLQLQRNPFLNFMIPIGMGLLKLRAAIMGGVLPFTEDPELETEETGNLRFDMISRLEEILAGRDSDVDVNGLVVLNFLKDHPHPEVRSKNRAYSLGMMKMLAEANAGPLHVGAAKSVVKGDASWDSVALVYYPGVQFMCDMLRSSFIRIGKDKKLGDTLAIFTTPMHV